MTTQYVSYPIVTVSSGGGGASVTIGALDGQSASANGASIVSNVLYLQSASASYPGLVNTTTQTFAGNKNFSGTVTSTDFISGSPGFSDTGVMEQLTLSNTAYAQAIIQNTSNGTGASADFIVSNNLGTASTYYGDLGINSSTFTGTGSLNIANAVYLYSESGDLVLATNTSNAIHLLTNNASTDAMQINTSNQVVLPALNTAGVLLNSASGVVSSSAGALAVSLGGTGVTSSTGSTKVVLSAGPAITGAWTLTDAGSIINASDSTKVLALSLSGMTTGKTLTLSSSQSTTQTLTIPNIAASDTLSTLKLAQTFTAVNTFSNATASTSTSTGAVVVSAGGLGVSGAIYGGGLLNIATAGSTLAGNVTVNYDGSSGTNMTFARPANTDANQVIWSTNGTSNWTLYSPTGGSNFALHDAVNGIDILQWTAGAVSAQVTKIPSTTVSTSSSSGALVVSGGVGISGATWIGGLANIAGTLTSGNHTVNNAGSTSVTLQPTSSASQRLLFLNYAGSGNYNFAISHNSNINGLELTPSTATDGSTFSNPAMTISSAASPVVNIPGTVASTSTSTGALTVGGGLGVVGSAVLGTIGTPRTSDVSTSTPRNDLVASSYTVFNGSATITVNGIAAGNDGQLLILANSTGNNLTITHQSASATGAQILCPGDADMTIPQHGGLLLIYDGGGGYWRAVHN